MIQYKTMSKKVIKIGLLGLGFVGKGVIELLNQNKALLESRTQSQFEVSKIAVRSPEKYKDTPIGNATLTTSVDDMINDPEIQVIIELIGGEEPAKTHILNALKAKKHVITANKEVVSKHKTEFFKTAQDNGVDLYFEAAVGGSIPLIRALKVGYAANDMEEVLGILNGTTNYILTKMTQDKKEFTDILSEAQKLGLAEADPTMDISGADAAHKLVILAATAFKKDIQIDNVYHEGIDKIKLKDIEYAEELGYAIKLIAKGTKAKDSYSFSVFPLLLEKNHTLAAVNDEVNALFVKGNAIGDAMITGKGAGGLPTASAVVSDLIDLSFTLDQPLSRRNLETNLEPVDVASIDELESAYYIRLLTADTPGALEHISHAFSSQDISIDKLVQKERHDTGAEIVIVTHSTFEKKINQTLDEIKKLSEVKELSAKIRVNSN